MEHGASPIAAWVSLSARAKALACEAGPGAERFGLLLALFMWVHMVFVSSILISKDAMWTVTKFFEGYFFFGTSTHGSYRSWSRS